MSNQSAPVNFFYDSDEDVCWGPITLREVKRDLKRMAKLQPNYRRQTAAFIPLPVEENPKMSSFASSQDYMTANESMESNNIGTSGQISANPANNTSHVHSDKTSSDKFQSINNLTDEKDNSEVVTLSSDSEDELLEENNVINLSSSEDEEPVPFENVKKELEEEDNSIDVVEEEKQENEEASSGNISTFDNKAYGTAERQTAKIKIISVTPIKRPNLFELSYSASQANNSQVDISKSISERGNSSVSFKTLSSSESEECREIEDDDNDEIVNDSLCGNSNNEYNESYVSSSSMQEPVNVSQKENEYDYCEEINHTLSKLASDLSLKNSDDIDVAHRTFSVTNKFNKSNASNSLINDSLTSNIEHLNVQNDSITSVNFKHSYIQNDSTTSDDSKHPKAQVDLMNSANFKYSYMQNDSMTSADSKHSKAQNDSINSMNFKHLYKQNDSITSDDPKAPNASITSVDSKQLDLKNDSITSVNFKHSYIQNDSTTSDDSKHPEAQVDLMNSANFKYSYMQNDSMTSADSKHSKAQNDSINSMNFKHLYKQNDSITSDDPKAPNASITSVDSKQLDLKNDSIRSIDNFEYSNVQNNSMNPVEYSKILKHSTFSNKFKEVQNDSVTSSQLSNSACSLDGYQENESLNDTFSEMQRLLKEGFESDSDDSTENVIDSTPYKANNSMESNSAHKYSKIPVPKSLSDDSSSNLSLKGDFKVPRFPMKLSKKTPATHKALNAKTSPSPLKNIISPVRLYINNSPFPTLKQTNKPGCTRSHTLDAIPQGATVIPKKHRNLLDSLPELVYKPSKLVKETCDNKIILPNNIKKLITERIVIKHEPRRRINFDDSMFSVEEKLRMRDLSCIVNDDQNMSVHVNKQGFNL